MDNSLQVVVGMTIAYAASLLGLVVAWISYRRRGGRISPGSKEERDDVGRRS